MTTSLESIFENVGMNSAILVKQSRMTRIISWLSDKGSPLMKSIEIESQGCLPIGRK